MPTSEMQDAAAKASALAAIKVAYTGSSTVSRFGGWIGSAFCALCLRSKELLVVQQYEIDATRNAH